MKISRRQLERIISEALEDESGSSTPPSNPYGLRPGPVLDRAVSRAARFEQPEAWSARHRDPIYDSHIAEVVAAAQAVEAAIADLNDKCRANVDAGHSTGMDSDFARQSNDWETSARINTARAMKNLLYENPKYLEHVRQFLRMSERLSRHETKRRGLGGA